MSSLHVPPLCSYFPSSYFSELASLLFMQSKYNTADCLYLWCQASIHIQRWITGFSSHLALAKPHLQIPTKQQTTPSMKGNLLSFGCIQHMCILLNSIISNIFDVYQDYTKLINNTDNRVGNEVFCLNLGHSFLQRAPDGALFPRSKTSKIKVKSSFK